MIANAHAALIVQTSTIHHVDAASSLPQSIDDLNLSNRPPSGAVARGRRHKAIHAQVSLVEDQMARRRRFRCATEYRPRF